MSPPPRTTLPRDPVALVPRVLDGDVRAGARLMRLLDDRGTNDPEVRRALEALYPHTGKAAIVGITGNPGSGKSTLASRLVGHYRERGLRVGIACVDPSSPFTGGAILGDRIRMADHASDDGVFIRSLATRGALGGLSGSTHGVVHVLDAMGHDVVIVETVGVGQDEVDVVKLAHTNVVVLVPGLGDDIQAIKAGILEIADVFVVNKADLPGAERTVADLRHLQSLLADHPPWLATILETSARSGEGVPELAGAIEDHRAHLRATGALRARLRQREAHILDRLMHDRFAQALRRHLSEGGRGDAILDAITDRRADPFSAADELAAALIRDDQEGSP